jgi:hypothetical protein
LTLKQRVQTNPLNFVSKFLKNSTDVSQASSSITNTAFST